METLNTPTETHGNEQALNTPTQTNVYEPEQVHISITKTPTEMVIMWLTRAPTYHPICRYRKERNLFRFDDEDYESAGETEKDHLQLGQSKNVSIGDWKATFHTVTLVNLMPHTDYIYSVGDRDLDIFSQEFNFTSRHYGTFPFTMVTFADFLVTNEITKQKQVIKRLKENLSQFDIILEFGDICYADGDQSVWDLFFNHIQTIAACKPWMVTVGNHEDEEKFGFAAFENRFKMPGKNNFWYSFDYGFAHFVVISTEHPLTEDSPQYKFIVQDLEKTNRHREIVPWVILTGHRALYGSNKRWFHKPKAERQRKILIPIIDKYHVDLALFGHCHAYERTHPIYDGEVDPRGTIYLLAGVAGAELDKEWQMQPQWSAYRTAHHGYGLLHVKGAKKLRFCYHRERDGKMWDAFTLTKRQDWKKTVSYDYQNKFLKNWITLGESDAKVERKRQKAEERAVGMITAKILSDSEDEIENAKITIEDTVFL